MCVRSRGVVAESLEDALGSREVMVVKVEIVVMVAVVVSEWPVVSVTVSASESG